MYSLSSRRRTYAVLRPIFALALLAWFAPLSLAAQAQAPGSISGLPASGGPEQGQGAARSGVLRLGDAYAGVRQVNPKAAAARSLAEAVLARVPGAGLPPDPQLQVGFMNYAVPRLRPMDPLGMVQLQVMQMLPTAGKLGLSSRAELVRYALAEGLLEP